MRIAVFGLYVGTVMAAGLASRGHEVCGVDVDAVKLDHVRSGRSAVVEPGIDNLIATAVEGGRRVGRSVAATSLIGRGACSSSTRLVTVSELPCTR
jgi:UDP-glucose 6-dehydrogenase